MRLQAHPASRADGSAILNPRYAAFAFPPFYDEFDVKVVSRRSILSSLCFGGDWDVKGASPLDIPITTTHWRSGVEARFAP